MRQAVRPSVALSLAFVAVFATACVTINVYFPEAAVKDLSQQIEAAVAERARQAAEADADEPSTSDGGMASLEVEPSHLLDLNEVANIAVGHVLHWLSAPQTYAAEPVAAPEITNPAIRKIIESRGQRVPELRALKDQGVVGENNQSLGGNSRPRRPGTQRASHGPKTHQSRKRRPRAHVQGNRRRHRRRPLHPAANPEYLRRHPAPERPSGRLDPGSGRHLEAEGLRANQTTRLGGGSSGSVSSRNPGTSGPSLCHRSIAEFRETVIRTFWFPPLKKGG